MARAGRGIAQSKPGRAARATAAGAIGTVRAAVHVTGATAQACAAGGRMAKDAIQGTVREHVPEAVGLGVAGVVSAAAVLIQHRGGSSRP